MKWISVEDRLPDEKKMTKTLVSVFYTLAKHHAVTVHAAEYDGWSKSWEWYTRFCAYSEDEINIVTHWMPLPKPPKGEK